MEMKKMQLKKWDQFLGKSFPISKWPGQGWCLQPLGVALRGAALVPAQAASAEHTVGSVSN